MAVRRIVILGGGFGETYAALRPTSSSAACRGLGSRCMGEAPSYRPCAALGHQSGHRARIPGMRGSESRYPGLLTPTGGGEGPGPATSLAGEGFRFPERQERTRLAPNPLLVTGSGGVIGSG